MTYVDAAIAPIRKTGQIKIYGSAAFEAMRKAGQLVARCLDMLTEHVGPGVPTEKIDHLVFEYAMDHGALPATLMYRGYKKSTCTSLNHVVCHGIPGDKPLKDGDIVNIDVTLILDGWHGDSSRMFTIGEIPRRAERLIEVTHEATMRGIASSPLRGAELRCSVSSSRPMLERPSGSTATRAESWGTWAPFPCG